MNDPRIKRLYGLADRLDSQALSMRCADNTVRGEEIAIDLSHDASAIRWLLKAAENDRDGFEAAIKEAV